MPAASRTRISRTYIAAADLALTVPREFGGGGVSIIEATLAQERLARGDGSTALGTAMHLSIVGRIGRAVVSGEASDAGGWDRERYARLARAIVEEGATINSAASEPETGSPSRGGRPGTRAVPDGDGWFRISGRKTFTTMAPGLRFIMVAVTIELEDGPEAAQFLLESDAPGLRVEETWDTVGMRASGSHDLVLEDVRAPASAILTRRPYSTPSKQPPVEPSGVNAITPTASAAAPLPPTRSASWASSAAPVIPSGEPALAPAPIGGAGGTPQPGAGAGWAALIPAVYLGIAGAAADVAVRFARDRKPQPLGGKSIGELPAVQRTLGEIEVALAECRALLFGVAEAWDEAPAQRNTLVPLLAAAKYVVTNRGIEITDKAMRVVGGAGLAWSHPVQRYYRDIRAGLHHPPMDDVALTTLARAALDRAE